MMLSLFPSLLYLDAFTPLLLRLTLALVFVLWARDKFKGQDNRKKQIGVAELIIGIMLAVGYLTQLAALVAVIILGLRLIKKIQTKAFLTDGVNYYLILFVIAFTLLLSGPGPLSFDLPL